MNLKKKERLVVKIRGNTRETRQNRQQKGRSREKGGEKVGNEWGTNTTQEQKGIQQVTRLRSGMEEKKRDCAQGTIKYLLPTK